jgi:acyl transferase domain-containing protein
MMRDSEPGVFNGVAVIGMSGRFPGARNLAEFWNNLRNGVESISFLRREEIPASPSRPGTEKNPDFVNAAGVLDDIELFDAAFFGFNPVEAATLDPQHRLLLECAWHAMEDAGYDPEAFPGPIGIYAGAAMSSYLFNILSNPDHREIAGDFLTFTGNDRDFLTTRVSYKLNLKGPSIAVQSACSTSLVAIVAACNSLLARQCDMALAGGVAVRVPQKAGYVYQEGQIFSRDGHTRSFDAEASGTLFSNGVGLVVLKRLEDAIADGDNIHAVIRGSAVNNDGSLKVGYTAPSVDAQAEVVAMAHALAEVDPRTIGYVEAHGTATPMGDSIEIAALTKAFRSQTQSDDTNFCAIGSVKANIGHADTASGVAAFIKAALALEHRAIPPAINFTRPNSAIDFKNSPFFVNTQLSDWPSGDTPRRAGVHSFGIGGTNAHVVLEEAPDWDASPTLRSRHLVVLSARSKSALQATTANFISHFQQHPELNLADVSYTCQAGRREFAQRQILVCKDLEDAAAGLADPSRILKSTKAPTERSITFLFPGRGAEHVNMASELYSSEPTFRTHVDRCSELLNSALGFDLRSRIYPPDNNPLSEASTFADDRIADLALFVVEYALAQLWMEWGVHPHVMLGQGIGEYVAACLADVFSLEHALLLLAEQGGAASLKQLSLRPPKIPLVSKLTGKWITAEEPTNPNYWTDPAHETPHFTEDVNCLLGSSNRTFLEIGPGCTLTNAIQEHPAWLKEHVLLSSLPAADHNPSELESMLNALGRLWLQGTKINWAGFWRYEKRRRVSLPAYAFDRKHYWVEPAQPSLLEKQFNSLAQGESDVRITPSPRSVPAALGCESTTCAADAPESYAAPSDEVEIGVAAIWQRLLGVERVGAYDNFFALGGHSMLGAQLLTSLRLAFHVEIPLPSLFEVPTVAGMAERIREFR